MPFMFIIAGYAEGIKSKVPGTLFRLKKCVVDLYLPCMYFSLAMWLPKFILQNLNLGSANIFDHVSLSRLFKIPFYGFNHCWFLSALFFVKVIHIMLEHLNISRYFQALLWIITFFSYQLLLENAPLFWDNAPVFLYYGLYFYAGFVIRRENIVTSACHPKALYGIIFLLAGMIFFSVSYFYGQRNVFTVAAAATFTSLAMFIMFYAWNVGNSLLVTCGVHSMVIFTLHHYVLVMVNIICRYQPAYVSSSPALAFLIVCSAGVLLPIAVIWLYKNVKCLRWIEYIFYPGKLMRK